MGRKSKTTSKVTPWSSTSVTEKEGFGFSWIIPLILALIITIVILICLQTFFGIPIDITLFMLGINKPVTFLIVGVILFMFMFIRLKNRLR
jgi:hypothetical protein